MFGINAIISCWIASSQLFCQEPNGKIVSELLPAHHILLRYNLFPDVVLDKHTYDESVIIVSLFQFEGQEIKMDPKVGMFITMNPGYAGRTELPESVKALFRPVVCIVPDLQMICLIMLFSEGFLQAKVSHCLWSSGGLLNG